ILADNGYLSQSNVEQCEAARIEPFDRPRGAAPTHLTWKQRFAPAPKSPPVSATALEKMAYRLHTPRGKKLYGLRKQTPEPAKSQGEHPRSGR
ncbi:transposase IS4 family protein, partial [mine drainage metagenome]